MGYKIKENIFSPYFRKINSRWVIELNVKAIKLVRGNIEEYPYDLGLGKDFLNVTQR